MVSTGRARGHGTSRMPAEEYWLPSSVTTGALAKDLNDQGFPVGDQPPVNRLCRGPRGKT